MTAIMTETTISLAILGVLSTVWVAFLPLAQTLLLPVRVDRCRVPLSTRR